MCGIAGIIHPDGPGRERLEGQAAALAHRGPDDVGYLLDGPFGVVQTLVSVIDLAGGHQPILSADGSLAVVANGEIYNFIELRAELEAKECVFSTHSDSETILHAYAVYGDSFIEKLHGMFAFCLVDKKRQRVILGRDRLGIKPLFFRHAGKELVFASELKGVLAALPSIPALHPEALLQFLQNQFNSGETTIFSGVDRLPPAHLLIREANGEVSQRRYWSPLSVQVRPRSFEAAVEEFEPLMETVMREHVRSDVPFGLFLSGGVDSAVLLALLTRYQNQPVRTFSVGYDQVRLASELDEAGFIAERFASRHSVLKLQRDQIFRRLVHTVWAADDLMRDYASLPTSFLAEEAGRELKVVFSGEGGDEAFAGYRRYRQQPLEKFFRNLFWPGSGGFRIRGQLRPSLTRPLFKLPLRQTSSAVRRPFIDAWQQTPAGWSDINRCQYTDLTTALPDNLLVKADRMLMSFGVEGRVPFLDHRIVEFGLSLPDELKLQGKVGKLFIKEWAQQKGIPRDHLYRSKRGFYVPIGEWLNAEFTAKLEGKLLANAAVQEWFEAEGVKKVFTAHRKNGQGTREIWCLMQFAIWHRLFVEDFGVRPSPEEDPLDWIS